jgi:3-hydroxyisobutyrate dehydrogenase-like beta-hydroxyacid dehydrogenase
MKPVMGVIGLGIMGGAMAEVLLEAGYQVSGFDPKPAALRRLKKARGTVLSSAAAVAEQSDVVIVSLATARALAVVVAELAAARPKRKPIIIETSTLPIADKDAAAAALANAGMRTLDCPISGTAVRLKQGAWTIFVSGDAATARKTKDIFAEFTSNAPYVGAFGNGMRMKFIANHMVAIHNVAVAESLTFARKMGLDAQQVWDLFATSPVIGNGVFKLRGKFMVDRNYLPATMKVEVWQKDMQVIGDMAKAVNCPTPLFSACGPIFNAAMAQGLSQHDTASVCEVLDAMAGGTKRERKKKK